MKGDWGKRGLEKVPTDGYAAIGEEKGAEGFKVADAQLFVDALEVGAGGPFGDMEFVADHGVVEAGADEGGDLALARGEGLPGLQEGVGFQGALVGKLDELGGDAELGVGFVAGEGLEGGEEGLVGHGGEKGIGDRGGGDRGESANLR